MLINFQKLGCIRDWILSLWTVSAFSWFRTIDLKSRMSANDDPPGPTHHVLRSMLRRSSLWRRVGTNSSTRCLHWVWRCSPSWSDSTLPNCNWTRMSRRCCDEDIQKQNTRFPSEGDTRWRCVLYIVTSTTSHSPQPKIPKLNTPLWMQKCHRTLGHWKTSQSIIDCFVDHRLFCGSHSDVLTRSPPPSYHEVAETVQFGGWFKTCLGKKLLFIPPNFHAWKRNPC